MTRTRRDEATGALLSFATCLHEMRTSELGEAAMRVVREVCGVAWTRLPGSQGEHAAQAHLAGKFRELGADDVQVRRFSVHAKFFLWWPRLSVLFFLASVAAYPFFPLLALALAACVVLNLYFKIFSYRAFDVLFPAVPSCNVVARLQPREGTKRVVLLGGHVDSNYEYPISRRWGASGFVKAVVPAFAAMAFWLLAAAARFVLSTLVSREGLVVSTGAALGVVTRPDAFFVAALACLPYVLWLGFSVVHNLPVAGANDDLSGVAVVVTALAHFADPANRPRHVELWVVSFGSEEGGMMGSKAMAADVRRALDKGALPVDGRTFWVVNFDSVGANGPLHVATREPMYRVKAYSPEVYEQLAASAEATGVDVVVKPLSVGGTDSAPFARLGIPASAVLCFGDGTNPPNWHTREDVPDNVDPRGLENAVKLAIQFVRDVDDHASVTR
ncbi:MAG: M28 family metallopeptidase [Promethearchaeota archaeon]